jgi:hypothetical protein
VLQEEAINASYGRKLREGIEDKDSLVKGSEILLKISKRD